MTNTPFKIGDKVTIKKSDRKYLWQYYGKHYSAERIVTVIKKDKSYDSGYSITVESDIPGQGLKAFDAGFFTKKK